MRRRELPKHCSFETDRHGKPRVRFRKGKISRYLDHAGAPWTPAFMEAALKNLLDVVDDESGSEKLLLSPPDGWVNSYTERIMRRLSNG